MTSAALLTRTSANPSTGRLINEIYARLAAVEQTVGNVGTVDTSPATPVTVDTTSITLTDSSGNTVTLVPASPPATSLSLAQGTYLDDCYVDVTFVAPTPVAAQYVVQYAVKDPSTHLYGTVTNLDTLTTTVRIHSLLPNTTYGFRVVALNNAYVASSPCPASGFQDVFVTGDTNAPGQVTGVAITVGLRSMVIAWNDNPDLDVRQGAGTYRVQVSTVADFSVITHDSIVGATVVSYSDAVSGQTYYTRVAAIDSSNNEGPWSSTASTVTAQLATADFSQGVVQQYALGNGAVGAPQLNVPLAIDSTGQITNGSINQYKLADKAVVASKLGVTVGGGNILLNSAFQSSPNSFVNWSGFAGGNAYSTYGPDTSTYFYGNQSMKDTVVQSQGYGLGNDGGLAYFGAWQDVSYPTPSVVTGSAWLKATAGRQIGIRIVNHYNGQTQYDNSVQTYVVATGSWQRVQVTSPADTHSTGPWGWHVRAGLNGSDAVPGDVCWIGAVQLELGDVATAYAPKADEVLPGTIGTTQIAQSAVDPSKLNVPTILPNGQLATGAVDARVLSIPVITSTGTLAAGSVTAASVGFAIGGANLLSDSSYEGGIARTDSANGATATLDSTFAHGGTHSAKVVLPTTGAQTGLVLYTSGVTLSPNTNYMLSAWVFLSTGNTPGQVYLSPQGASVTSINYNAPGYSVGTAGVWTRIQVPFKSAATNLDQLSFYALTTGATAGQTFWVDDVQLESGDVATAYAPKMSEVLPGTITSAALAAGSVGPAALSIPVIDSTGHIVAGSVGTPQIATGAVTAAGLAPASVDFSKLVVSALPSSVLTNGNFEGGTNPSDSTMPLAWSKTTGPYNQGTTGGVAVIGPATGYSPYGTSVRLITSDTNSTPNFGYGTRISVTPGDVWVISFNAIQSVQANSMYMRLMTFDANGNTVNLYQGSDSTGVSGENFTIFTTDQVYTFSFTIGTGVYFIQPYLLAYQNGARTVYVDNFRMFMSSGTFIAPSSIGAGQLNVPAAIDTSGHITAGSIGNAQITTGAVNARALSVAAIDGNGNLTAGSVTTNALNVILGGGNLVSNSSFESPNPGVPYVNFNGWGGSGSQSYVPGRFGGQAIRLTSSTYAYLVQNVITLQAGTYVATVWMRCNALTSSNAGMWIEGLPSDGSYFTDIGTYASPVNGCTGGNVNASNLTTGWFRAGVIIHLNSAASFNINLHNQYGGNGIVGSVDFDDVQLEQGSVPTAYAPATNEILPGTILGTMVAAQTITGDNIQGQTITATNLKAGAVTANAISAIIGGGNLLNNSGFEAGTLVGWTPTTYDGSGTISTTITSAQHMPDSAESVLLVGASNGDQAIVQSVPCLPNTTYTLSAWYISPNYGSGAVASNRMLLAICYAVVELKNTVGNIGTWTRFVQSFTTGPTDSSITLRLYGSTGGVYWDDVQIEQGQVATAYSPIASEILPGTIVGAMVAAQTITGSNIMGQTITGDRMVAGTLTATQIQSQSITGDRMVVGTITATQLAAGSVTAAKLVVADFTDYVTDPYFSQAQSAVNSNPDGWNAITPQADQGMTRVDWSLSGGQTGYNAAPSNHAQFAGNFPPQTAPTIVAKVTNVHYDDMAVQTASQVAGVITVPTAGTYAFGIDCDDNAELYLNGALAGAYYGGRGEGGTPIFGSANLVLSVGQVVPFVAQCINNGGAGGQVLYYSLNGGAWTLVPDAWLSSGVPYPNVGAMNAGAYDCTPSYDVVACQPGDQFYVEAYWRNDGSALSANGVYIGGWFTDDDTSYFASSSWNNVVGVSGASGYPTLSIAYGGYQWNKLSAVVTAPAQCIAGNMGPVRYFRPWLRNAGSRGWSVTGVHVRRMQQGSLIVDGSITGTKILAGTITAANIMGQTITADKVQLRTLTADQVALNGLTANVLNVTVGGGNLLANSGFEDSTGYSNGWYVSQYGYTSAGSAYEGTTCVALTCNSGTYSNAGTWYQYGVPIVLGQTYTFSAWIKNPTSGGIDPASQLRLDLNLVNETQGGNKFAASIPADGLWHRYSVTTTFTSTASTSSVYTRVLCTASTGTFYLDACQLELGDVPTMYTPKTSEILPGTIVGSMIYGQTITGDKIQGQTITAANIASGTITAQQIAVTALSGSVVPNGNFENGTNPSDATMPAGFSRGGWNGWGGAGGFAVHTNSQGSTGGVASSTAYTAYGTSVALTIVDGNSTPSFSVAARIPVTPGDVWVVSFNAVSTLAGSGHYVRADTWDINGNFVATDFYTDGSTGEYFSVLLTDAVYVFSFTIPSNVYYIAPWILSYGPANPVGHATYINNFSFAMRSGTFIAPGSITTGMISAQSITSSKLYSGTVQASLIQAANIATGTITAQQLYSGTVQAQLIQASNLSAGSVTANALNVIMGGGNLLADSSFEAGNNWGGGGGNPVLVAGQGRNGGKAILLTAAGGSLTAVRVAAYTAISVIANQTYTLSYWARAYDSNSALPGLAQLTWQCSGGYYDGPLSVVNSTSQTLQTYWQRFSYTLTATTNGFIGGSNYVDIRMRPNGLASGNNYSMYVDDVQIEEGNVATAYAPMTNEILPGTIVGAMIQGQTITADLLYAGTVQAKLIQAGNLAAGSVTANALNVIVGGGNLVSNSSFENRTNFFTNWLMQSNTTTAVETSTVYPTLSQQSAKVVTAGSGTYQGIYTNMGALPAGPYVASIYIYATVGTAIRMVVGDGNASTAVYASQGVQNDLGYTFSVTGWQRLTTTVFNHNTSTNGVGLYIDTGSTSQAITFYVDNVQFENGQVATAYAPLTNEILPGTIVASMLYSGTVQAQLIQAANIATGIITADKIVSGGITAAVITSGVMSGARIQAGTLSAGAITSGSLTSATITLGSGGLLTAPGTGSGGLQFGSTGITATNSAGTQTFRLDQNGNLTLTGTIAAGSTISSPTITGGTLIGSVIETATTGTYLVLSQSAQHFNNADGSQTPVAGMAFVSPSTYDLITPGVSYQRNSGTGAQYATIFSAGTRNADKITGGGAPAALITMNSSDSPTSPSQMFISAAGGVYLFGTNGSGVNIQTGGTSGGAHDNSGDITVQANGNLFLSTVSGAMSLFTNSTMNIQGTSIALNGPITGTSNMTVQGGIYWGSAGTASLYQSGINSLMNPGYNSAEGAMYFRYSSSVYAQLFASAFTTGSSVRFKNDVVTLTEEDGESILKLRPVSYRQKHDDTFKHGLIAEEVHEVMPHVVGWGMGTDDEDDDDVIVGLNYQELLPTMIVLLQSYARRITALESALAGKN